MTVGVKASSRSVAVLVALVLAAALLGPSAAAQPPRAPGSGTGPSQGTSAAPSPGTGADAAPDEVIVRWSERSRPPGRADARGDHGIAHARSMRRTGVELHTITPGQEPAAVALALTRDPRVAYAQPNYRLQPHAQPPSDPLFPSLWGLRNTGQPILGQLGLADIDVDVLDAWDQTQGEDVVVAVIDEGTDRDHPDLNANMWVNPDPGSDPRYPEDLHGWDFVNSDNTVFDAADGDDHGTHVSGTLAAVADNDVGIAGVAPEATIMPLKFLGPGGGDTSDAILAIEYAAARGVRVANNSWGGTTVNPALRDAIANSGLVFVASAGNPRGGGDGTNLDDAPFYPCSFDLPNVVCVAALDHRGALASYSHFGASTVHVGAPGSAVLSTVPRALDTPVALQVDTPTYDAMYWGFDLSDVEDGPPAHAEILDAALEHLGTAVDDPILLVDDDESASGAVDARATYTAALDAAGYTAATVHAVPPDADGPRAAQMAGHTVVWFTGGAFGDPEAGITTLTSADQANLATFLDGGGRLLLAGADAVLDIEGSPLVRTWLHAEVVGEVTGRAGLQGGPDSVYAGRAYDLVANPFITHVEPRSGAASPALIYPGAPTYDEAYAYFNGTSMASPHVAGVAALVAAARPDLSAPEIADLVTETVMPLSSLDGRTTTGGMVSAARAVAAASGGTGGGPPSAPRDVVAEPAVGAATLTWSAPTLAGASPISEYTVTASPGGATTTVDGDAREATIAGLASGQEHTFTVRAANADGHGPPSATSEPVVVRGLPGPPTAVAATPGAGSASVAWAAPTDDGGDPLTGYTVTAAPGGATATVDSDARQASVTGLTGGQAYTFTVRATNAMGAGEASEPSAPVTALIPDACPAARVPSAGFTDVAASNIHASAIDCAAWHGLAQGTSATAYGPGASVRRDQMAAFIGRLVAETGVDMTATGTAFDDVAGNVHEAHINALAAAGIVEGVAPGTYAPGSLVTRDQMAAFLTRTYEFIAEEALPAPAHGFDDVAGNVHATAIAKAAGADFARGLAETSYGPRLPVRRDQMASFLTRVLQRLVTDGLAAARP